MPQVSKIALLPAELRERLHKEMVARGFGDIVGLTDELNTWCIANDVGLTIGKSAVGAESQRVRRAQEAIRATTEAAKLMADSSRDDGDTRSEAAMAIVQSEMFNALLQAGEAEAVEDPFERMALLSKAGTSLARLSRARVNQAKWRSEVDARAKAAADAVSKIAKKGGLDAKTVAEIRSSILGIVKRDEAAAA